MDTKQNPLVGRAVTVDEFAPFASPKCKMCFNKGVIVLCPVKGIDVKGSDGKMHRGQLHVPRACGCAVRRFCEAHEGKLSLVVGQPIEWLKAHEPAL